MGQGPTGHPFPQPVSHLGVDVQGRDRMMRATQEAWPVFSQPYYPSSPAVNTTFTSSYQLVHWPHCLDIKVSQVLPASVPFLNSHPYRLSLTCFHTSLECCPQPQGPLQSLCLKIYYFSSTKGQKRARKCFIFLINPLVHLLICLRFLVHLYTVKPHGQH